MELKKLSEGIFSINNKLATKNLVPGNSVYGEELIRLGGMEYREWNPFRSKLAAAIKKGIHFSINPSSSVLYLGASTGTTISHLSDILTKGVIYAVEISAISMNKLLELAEKRENIIPILADARMPEEYEEVGKVDYIYQDVAQPDQADILLKNSSLFLKKNGIAFFCVKSQSIDAVKNKEEVFSKVKEQISDFFEIVESTPLEPYDKDHLFLVLRRKRE